jgi:type IV pilus assembly protein PilP
MFPIESLKMVERCNRTSPCTLVHDRQDRLSSSCGNYMGQNFGIITSINDGEIKLRELVQDSSGDWAERQSRLLLDDQEQKK